MFDNLNPYQNLEFIFGDSPKELKDQLLQINHPIKIISMYSQGTKHYVWFISEVKIIKSKKGNK